MTGESSRPAAPPPETVDQALAILLNAMGQEPGDNDGQENLKPDVNHLDRLAWCYQVASEALQLVAQTRVIRLRRQHNALLPINRLPPELLAGILLESINNTRPRLLELQELAQVTWRWWQVIKADPQFWTYICPPLESVALQIRKAGVLPLHLDWTVRRGSTDPGGFKRLLEDHADRWTSMNFDSCREGVGLQALCTKHFPHLRYLRVHQIDDTVDGSWKLNFAECQNVQEAELPIMPYFSASHSSTPPVPLRVLHLDLGSMEAHSSHDLESLLQLTPQLVALDVENLYVDTTPPSSPDAPIINLPTLRHLGFTNVGGGRGREWIPLIARIRAPQLHSLELSYNFDTEGWPINIDARTIFDELLTLPNASLKRPKEAPFSSALSHVHPSSSWIFTIMGHYIEITAEGGGQGRLNVSFYTGNPKEDLIRHILVHLAPFALPIDIHVTWKEATAEALESWGMTLDAMPSLRSFSLNAPLQVAQQIISLLSNRTQSPGTTGPRAPYLEKLQFRCDRQYFTPWSSGDEGDDIKDMLEKRSNLFIEGGVPSPPKMTVEGPRGFIFNEAESKWFATSNSDSVEA